MLWRQFCLPFTHYHSETYACSLTLQWAEVLSADAFSAFEDAGLDSDKVWLNLTALILILIVYSFADKCS